VLMLLSTTLKSGSGYTVEINTLQHTATHCNKLQHTAIRCNTLQHTVVLMLLSTMVAATRKKVVYVCVVCVCVCVREREREGEGVFKSMYVYMCF